MLCECDRHDRRHGQCDVRCVCVQRERRELEAHQRTVNDLRRAYGFEPPFPPIEAFRTVFEPIARKVAPENHDLGIAYLLQSWYDALLRETRMDGGHPGSLPKCLYGCTDPLSCSMPHADCHHCRIVRDTLNAVLPQLK